jgi:hypothetical protein
MPAKRRALTDEQKLELREAFDLFDSEQTGRIDYHELKVHRRWKRTLSMVTDVACAHYETSAAVLAGGDALPRIRRQEGASCPPPRSPTSRSHCCGTETLRGPPSYHALAAVSVPPPPAPCIPRCRLRCCS